MPRLMSFAMTTPQVRARTKTVTRRTGWKFLKAGERLIAVEKSRGLKKGEQMVRVCLIEVVSVRLEPLSAITAEDVILEGFPEMTRDEFIAFFAAGHACTPADEVTRIEFKYID